MSPIHWTEVDGVPTVWTDTRGPFFALLQFRTGRADETYLTAGRTHLLEHLAMSAVEDPSRRQNGFVTTLLTGFHASGRPDDVVAFLSGVCQALRDPPGGRLEVEKRILGAEAATSRSGIAQWAAIWRFGAGGFGLVGQPEEGLPGATLDDLRQLSMERFTRGNAVLCLSGPPPRGLSIDLPPGARVEPPSLAPVVPALPGWVGGTWGQGAATSAIIPRVPACRLLWILAEERLRSRLRTEMGVSYSPAVHYEPLSATEAHLVLSAEAPRDRQPEMAAAFLDVVEALGDATEAELEPTRARIAAWVTDARATQPDEFGMSEAQRAAFDRLIGMPWESAEEGVASVARVGADDIADLGRCVRETAIHFLPAGTSLRTWIGKEVPASTAEPVRGEEVLHRDFPIIRQALVHGREGVSFRDGQGIYTVRFDELAGAISHEDGGLVLVARDGYSLRVEPTLWRDGADVCREIFDRVPSAMLLRRPARDPRDIPRPSTTVAQRGVATVREVLLATYTPHLEVGKLVGLMLGITALSALAIFAAIFVLQGIDGLGRSRAVQDNALWIDSAVKLMLGLGGVVSLWVALKRPRR